MTSAASCGSIPGTRACRSGGSSSKRRKVMSIAPSPANGGLAGRRVIERCAQRVEVRTRGRLAAAGLLGRDVVGRAEQRAGRGQLDVAAVEGARQAEVGQVRDALLVEQDVLRLDVAVDDPRGVRGGQRARDPDADQRHPLRRQRALLGDDGLQRRPVDEIHHDVGPALVVLADVVDGHDVGVHDLGRRQRLAPEALVEDAALVAPPLEQLDRDLALEHGVQRHEDRRHPAVAGDPVEPVAPAEQPLRPHRPSLFPKRKRRPAGAGRLVRHSSREPSDLHARDFLVRFEQLAAHGGRERERQVGLFGRGHDLLQVVGLARGEIALQPVGGRPACR